MIDYIFFVLLLYGFSYLYYINISHGLGRKAELLQLRRFLPCAIIAVLTPALTNQSLSSPAFLVSLLIGVLWILTYPSLYYFTFHKNSSDFGFHLDVVFGLYFIGWSFSIKFLINYFSVFPTVSLTILSLFEFAIIVILLLQWLYYTIYKTCINDNAIMLLRGTDFNEAIEFYRSLPLYIQISSPCAAFFLCFAIIVNNHSRLTISFLPISSLYIIATTVIFMTFYLWNSKKGVFIRTGIIELFLDVQNYLKETASYRIHLKERLATLKVTHQDNVPQISGTVILVIGESESRDYMSAFCDYEYDTTPWLKQNKNNRNFILFPNAYACADQTVPALEMALTEANQYTSKKFFESCSIIDIAKAAGYKTYWFSNQGHIGSAETAITLIANTADKAIWTKQNLNNFQYDETLLEYLKEADPKKNNFIVLHLIGNHFNFINRYPYSFSTFSKPGKYDLIPNYIDSIAYTDYVLQKVTEYAQENLNLQALLYFSDHGTLPDKRRSPNFDGFGTVRIPMFAYFSDEYIQKNNEIYQTLSENQHRYFTNDLAYDLMCSIFNIKSNHFDETNSLASPKYKFTREMLTTDLGKMYIKNDTTK